MRSTPLLPNFQLGSEVNNKQLKALLRSVASRNAILKCARPSPQEVADQMLDETHAAVGERAALRVTLLSK